MKQSILLALFLMTLAELAAAQVQQADAQIANRTAVSKPVPLHLVYRHFLGWVKDLDLKASASGALDRYEFAKPFAERAGLAERHIDVIRTEAYSLDHDLCNQDAEAKLLIQAFRQSVTDAVAKGWVMPPRPVRLKELQRQRDTLIMSHVSILRAALGRDAATKLEDFLSREVAPHISLTPIAIPHRPKAGMLPR